MKPYTSKIQEILQVYSNQDCYLKEASDANVTYQDFF